ncbi:MAG: hypothetical protein E7560_04700 [Ruminococcaceae bacterium]|nr:hypothetical protein [Oscillospiraceae bacterium]
MKKLSTVQILYVYLISKIFVISASFILVVIFGENAVSIVKESALYIVLDALIVIFAFFNLSFINNNFKKAAIFKIATVIISVIGSLAANSSPVITYNFFLSDILQFLELVLALPTVYYLYSGFGELATVNNDNFLSAKWQKIRYIRIFFAVLSIIGCLLFLYEFFATNLLFAMLFSILLPLVSFIIEIIELLYAVKTIKITKETIN